MPTNEERREVAARLRNWESFRETFRESPICAALDVLNVEGYLDWRGVCELLADLIEPEPERTCKDVSLDDYTGDYELDDMFTCSACGWEYDNHCCAIPFPRNYCPSCGARVVER